MYGAICIQDNGNDDVSEPANSLPERITRYLGPTYYDQVITINSLLVRVMVITLIVLHLSGMHLAGYEFVLRFFGGFGSLIAGSIKLMEANDVFLDDRPRARKALRSGLLWLVCLAYVILQ